ncbi:MAG: helix-turn-helix transcriptional regulator [Dehalococcoidia bacterium]|nr:helix-turn-helix transcriptional regulator [Dehalococcoidia bacterium]
MKAIDGLTTDEERAAAIFRALGNPARVRIIMELARQNACVTGDLVEVLPLAQSTVSEHLKVLREAGIVLGSSNGRDARYCLDPEAVRWLANFCFGICCPPGGNSACACDVPCACD